MRTIIAILFGLGEDGIRAGLVLASIHVGRSKGATSSNNAVEVRSQATGGTGKYNRSTWP